MKAALENVVSIGGEDANGNADDAGGQDDAGGEQQEELPQAA